MKKLAKTCEEDKVAIMNKSVSLQTHKLMVRLKGAGYYAVARGKQVGIVQ